ncbi:carboxymuconolactone decarboxylase family protein [Micromonospora craniellae]|uniref:Carboxymuconolactone decarboxylase family protein n=1 Tax=Micromonospora craniellae TaxID=2294034 RepID=A0A372FSF5_9ACTN|nr:carboxymuconolactone decarboxylase family protein [Micromonospora craniellae]QOC92298.1 carboxymuconolactone decarboxylase family protein [Micromonospora craniellae]RFS43648.1 carboxymuconolactone decarboxylase family protein [Micromonospora craniellae]
MEFDRTTLTSAQDEVYRALTEGRRSKGPRLFEMVAPDGGLYGPFHAMLANPEAGMALQRLGATLRYTTGVDPAVRELVILAVAAAKRNEYEWYAHAAVAASLGVPADVVHAVGQGETPVGVTAAARAALRVTRCLVTGTPFDTEPARETLGRAGLATVICLVGYYTMLADLDTVDGGGLPPAVVRRFGHPPEPTTARD